MLNAFFRDLKYSSKAHEYHGIKLKLKARENQWIYNDFNMYSIYKSILYRFVFSVSTEKLQGFPLDCITAASLLLSSR